KKSTTGGYQTDENLYQAVKGMTAAEATSKEGGTIIMVAGAKTNNQITFVKRFDSTCRSPRPSGKTSAK
ncbi:hypothetical protein, partial [Lactiplantibacillus plantarum]|uniref:hypothetical protein n=1 Tax=Lactiplantibacillus plantarum TaxID=1590 RepID=UPI003C1EF52C